MLLILYRGGITQDFLGLLYGVDKTAISCALRRIKPIVTKVLSVQRTIRVSTEEVEALIVDVTEQIIQKTTHRAPS